jgi:hypothetical protein
MNHHAFILYLLVAACAAAIINIHVKVYTDSNENKTTSIATQNTVQALSSEVQNLNDTTTQGLSLSFKARKSVAFINVQGAGFFNGFIYDTDVPTVNISETFPENLTTECNCTENLFYNLEIFALEENCCVYSYISSDFKFICMKLNYSEPYYGCTTLTDRCSLISGTSLKIEGVRTNNVVLLFRNVINNC